jgi:predicted ATP-grasp superfamily ATP-dependent carboligase
MDSTGRENPGAVVIGGDYQGLAIVRSVGRRGIKTCVVDDERSIARFSRYTTHYERVADLREERATVEALLEVGRRLGLEGWVVYPTREELVAALSRARDELSTIFRIPTPEWDVVRWAWDKRRTHELAERLSIPTAQTWWPRDRDELAVVAATAPWPVILKPAIKEHFIYATGDKAWRIDTADELLSRFDEAAAITGPQEMMVQELLPGDGRHRFAFCSFFKDGESVASLVARRTRQHPPDFGRASTFAETVDVPEVEDLGARFLREIGYYGLVEVEFMLDPRDGGFKLLDVNPRTWGYHSIGPRAGVDFPWLLFADQVGLPLERMRAETGIGWVRLLTDIPTALDEFRRGTLSPRAYLRSLRTADVEAVFMRDDLLPGFAELALAPYLLIKRGY